jgi:hypothetical protein
MLFDVKNGLNSHNLRISNFFEIVKDPNPILKTDLEDGGFQCS